MGEAPPVVVTGVNAPTDEFCVALLLATAVIAAIVGTEATTSSEKAAVAVTPVWSVAVTVYVVGVRTPAGVPEIIPVAGSILRALGSEGDNE